MLDGGILDISQLDEIDLVERENGIKILNPSQVSKLKIIGDYPELLSFVNLTISINMESTIDFPKVFFKVYPEWLNFDAAMMREGQKWAAHIIHNDLSIIDSTLLCKGRGGAAKTKYINVWINMLGKINCFCQTGTKFGDQFGLARLPGTAGYFLDNVKWGSIKNPELYMEREEIIASHGALTVEKKGIDDITVYPTAPLVQTSANSNPWADSGDQSGRRLFMLLFPNFWDNFKSAAFGKPDPSLGNKLDKELAGIFWYFILPGIKMLRKDGRFFRPESSKEAYDDLETTSHKYSQFIKEQVTQIKRSELHKLSEEEITKTSATLVPRVWDAYKNWYIGIATESQIDKNTAYKNIGVFSRQFSDQTGIGKIRWPKGSGQKWFVGILLEKPKPDEF
jgi:hypothetical protein